MKKLFPLALLCVLAVPAFASTNHYVTPSGAGDKSGVGDWTHACSGFSGACAPSSLTCGDTYYVAGGGTYSGFNTNNCSVDSTIKGATVADHGAANGWSAAMSVDKSDGGGQAHWTCCNVSMGNHWIWDGVAGPVWSADPAAYGFHVDTPGDCNVNGHTFIGLNSNTTTAAVIRHVSATGCGPGSNSLQDYGVVLGYFTDGSTYNSGNTLGNSYFTNFNSCLVMAMANNDTMEYTYCDGNWSTPADHGETINISNGSQGGNTFRYNKLTNAQGTATLALIFTANGDSCVGRGVQIYGNLVVNGGGGNGVFSTGGDNQAFCNSHIYNNTVVNSGRFFWACESGGSGCAVEGGNVVENNLIYGGDGSIVTDGGSGISHDYNTCFSCTSTFGNESHGQITSGNPFVNSSAGDYRLKSDTALWLSLPAPFATDPMGVPRTSSRGVYQFASGGGPPSPPTALAAAVR